MEMHQLPIPKDVWGSMVLSRLSLKDYIRCSAVCRCWRRIAIENQRSLHSLPWLMFSQDKDTQTGLFYSLREGITYRLKFTEPASKSFCTGSTDGNLILSDGEANFVYNPFSQRTTPLPPQYVPLCKKRRNLIHNRYYYEKSVLSASNPSRSLLVASICSTNIVTVTCTSTDEEWSVFGVERCPILSESLPGPLPPLLPPQDENKKEDNDQDDQAASLANINEWARWRLMDIIFYRGVLYGLSELSTLVRFYNLEDANAKPQQVMNMVTSGMPIRETYTNCGYLVESSCGDLLMIFRIRNRVDLKEFKYLTEEFLVFKLDHSEDELRWVKMKSIGDEMIFLGRNSSISLSAKGIPGLKGNCIYFTDDIYPFWSCPVACLPVFFSDNGVFHLEDGGIDPFLPAGLSSSFKSQPIWVMPDKLVVDVDE